MMKKITLVFLFYCLLVSCGKKGDPEYKNPEKKVRIQTVFKNKANFFNHFCFLYFIIIFLILSKAVPP